MALRRFTATAAPRVLDSASLLKTELSQLRSGELALLRLPNRSTAQAAELRFFQERINALEKQLGIPQRRPTVTLNGSMPLTGSLNKTACTIQPAATNPVPTPPKKDPVPTPPKKVLLSTAPRSIFSFYKAAGISKEVMEKYIPLISAEPKEDKLLLAPAIQAAVDMGFSSEFILDFINSGPRFSQSFQYLNYLTLCQNELALTLAPQEQMRLVHPLAKKATAAELGSSLHSYLAARN